MGTTFFGCVLQGRHQTSILWVVVSCAALLLVLLGMVTGFLRYCRCRSCCHCYLAYLVNICFGFAMAALVDGVGYFICGLLMIYMEARPPASTLMFAAYEGIGVAGLAVAWGLTTILLFPLGDRRFGLRLIVPLIGGFVAFGAPAVVVYIDPFDVRTEEKDRLMSFAIGGLELLMYLLTFFYAKPCYCCGS